MITTKRQIVSDQDRYGGYNLRTTSRAQESKEDEVVSYSRKERGHDFSLASAETDVVRYSTRTSPEIENEHEQALKRTYAPKVSEYKYRKLGREEIMPNIKKEQPSNERVQMSDKKESVAFKTKVMLSVYVAVVVILATIVLATGYAINGAKSSVEGLENELAVKSQVVLSQDSLLSMYEDPTYNTGRATENGMEKINNDYTELELGQMLEPITYEERTNWFDKFCDFISKLSGN